MSKSNNLTDFLTDVANAIRSKKGTTSPINPQNFSTEIRNLPSGGGSESERVNALLAILDGYAETVTANDIYGLESIKDYLFYLDSSLYEINIPDTVYQIGDHAFFYSAVSIVNMADSVEYILANAFASCHYLESITLSKNLRNINNLVFYSCSSLANITLPDSITAIGTGAFQYCSALTEIIIPAKVTRIESGAFANCTKLTTVTLKATTPPSINKDIFNNSSNITKIIVPAGTSATYKAATNWSVYADKIVEA